ncbi:MAG: protein kinase, partial [Planctomycetota bacterium]
MKISTTLRTVLETLLVQRQWISSEELQKMTQHSDVPIEEQLLQSRIMTPAELEKMIEEAKQESEKKDSDIGLKKTQQDLAVLTRGLEKYQILEKLGQGGMGVVYKVRHLELDQFYALKLITESSSELLERFHREAKIIAKLKHPGIIQVIDSGQAENQHYFVMEFVEGKTLDQAIKEGLPIRKSVLLIKKVLDALSYAHNQKVIHRDLKPENIFITKQNEPKIGDFGLAKEFSIRSKNNKLTQSGVIMGTPMYMSPEQALGESSVDKRADIYSMGICLYEALTQRCPFEGKTLHELFHKVLSEEPTPPSHYNSDIHRDLETIILKAIEKEKSKRYLSATAFAEDLDCFLKGLPIQARPMSSSERMFRWSKKNRKFLILGTILILLFGCFLGYSQWHSKQQLEEKINQTLEKASHFSEASKKAFSSKDQINALFFALQHLNFALSMAPLELKIEQKKLAIGVNLLDIACENNEFQLAQYVVNDLELISFLNEKEIKEINLKVKQAKEKTLKRHQQRLEEIISKLKKNYIQEWEKDDIIFEITQMTEPEIAEQLIQIVQKGTDYFLNPKLKRELILEEFYSILLTALGRLKYKKSEEVLLDSLKKMRQKLAPITERQRLEEDSFYMLCVIQALGNLGDPAYFKIILDLIDSLGFGIVVEKMHSTLVKLAVKNDLSRNVLASSEAYEERSKIKSYVEDVQGSLEDIQQAIQLNSMKAENYHFKARLLRILAQYPEALLTCNEAIRLKSDSPDFYFTRGLIKRYSNDFHGAIQDSTKAIQLNQEFFLAYVERGMSKQILGELDEAIQDFNEAIRRYPRFSYAYNKRGVAKLGKQDIKGAIQDFNESILLNPLSGEVFCNRGRAKQK